MQQRALNKLTSLVLVAFTSYSFAAPVEISPVQKSQATNKACDAVLKAKNHLPPHAISYEKVRKDSYTAYADEFIQIMWPTYISGGDVLEVESEFFSRFIAKNLPELKRVHDYNRTISFSLRTLPHYEMVLEQFQLMDQYILRLEKNIQKRSLLKYKDMLQFAQVFARAHDREAYDKLKTLSEMPNAEVEVQRRYKLGLASVKQALDDIQVKAVVYGSYFQKQYGSDVIKYYISPDIKFPNPLPLPTNFVTGSQAFYNTYHLPVSPLSLATEYEPQDYNFLMRPTHNLSHELGHWRLQIYDTQSPSKKKYKADVLKLEVYLADLKHIVNARALETKDPNLNKVFYYLFYFLKFERVAQGPSPLNLVGIIDDLSGIHRTLQSQMPIAKLFLKLPKEQAPANDLEEFKDKIKLISEIVHDYAVNTGEVIVFGRSEYAKP